MNFFIKKGPKTVATFGVQLRPMNLCFIFALCLARFSGTQLVFCPALAPGWPEITAGTVFFFALFAARNVFAATYLGQTPPLFGGCSGLLFPRRTRRRKKRRRRRRRRVLEEGEEQEGKKGKGRRIRQRRMQGEEREKKNKVEELEKRSRRRRRGRRRSRGGREDNE